MSSADRPSGATLETSRDRPLVSVVIPAYNAASWLPATLETVAAQTWSHLEVIVVDDGSTDDTASVLATAEGPISVVHTENFGGPSRPRNLGVARARGDYVALFDSDDLMEPDKIERSVEVLERVPGADLVCTNFRSIDTKGQVLRPDYLAEYQDFRADLIPTDVPGAGRLPAERALPQLIRANFVGTSSVVCRRAILTDAGGFDESMKNGDDRDMWMRLADRGHDLVFLDRILHSYRVTPGGVTSRNAARYPAMIRALSRYLAPEYDFEVRRAARKQVRDLYLGRAWALRTRGDLNDALDCYRESLRLGWSARAALGRLRTSLAIATGRGRA